jgi:two-component system OmpR family sensor kinase
VVKVTYSPTTNLPAMLDSVRVRLTLWHVGVLAVLLISFSTGVYVFLRAHFFERADGILRSLGSATISILREELSESGLDELAARKAITTLDFPNHSITVFDEQGEVLAEKPAGISSQLPPPPRELAADRKFHMLSAISHDPIQDFRRIAVQRVVLEPTGRSYTIMTSRSLTPLLGELQADRLVLGISVPLGVLLAGLAGWFLSRKSLAPVLAMADQARRISAENLPQRLTVENPRDELGQLAATFNDLLSRLNSTFAQQRQFMADASHELRTPISVLRTAGSVILEKPRRTEEEYRSALTIVDEQSKRLSRIVDDMFRLARADAGRLAFQQVPFYLDELLVETARAASVLATSKNIEVHLPQLPESLCYGDEDLLRRMILNLVENAIKYTPEGGRVRVDLEKTDGCYHILISDNGIGIPEDARSHIFERFFRVDKGRSRKDAFLDGTGAGAGLGLAIARSIMEAHGGSLALLHSDQNGSTFEAILPVSGPHPKFS